MSVKGMDSFNRKISSLGEMQPDVEKAVKKYSEVVRGAAVKLCPVDTGELRSSIKTSVQSGEAVKGTIYTNKEYASYVEFGTGPVGQADHAGISPEADVSYRQSGWAYKDADGNFWHTNGQPAQAFMYPALKMMEGKITSGISADLSAAIRRKI